jgi:hypothetical protein
MAAEKVTVTFDVGLLQMIREAAERSGESPAIGERKSPRPIWTRAWQCSADQEVMTKRFWTLVTPAAFQAVCSA